MTDAISRSAALESAELISWYHVNQNGKMVSGASSYDEAYVKFSDVIAVLDDAKDLDVGPVVHARWVNGKCSRCKTAVLAFSHKENDGFGAVTVGNGDYCSNCGARMDGEENAAD